jgi:hypothetical protein
VKFEVTKIHIKTGLRGSAVECPVRICVKQTIKEKLKQETHVFVPAPDMLIISGVLFWLPNKVRDFLMAFDRGQSVEPMTFELDIPNDIVFVTPKLRKLSGPPGKG